MSVRNLTDRSRSSISALNCLLATVMLSAICAPSWSQTAFTKWTRYDAARREVGVIEADPDAAGPIHYAATRNTYDSRGVLTRVEVGELAAWQSELVNPSSWTGFTVFRQTDYSYDSFGRRLSQQTSSGGVAYKLKQFSYDTVGRLECTAKRMNTGAFAADLGIAACQLGSEGLIGPDRIERTTYDGSDRSLTITRGYSTSDQQVYATYTYLGAHVASARDANGNVSTYSVDGLGRAEYWYFPSKTTAGQTSATDFERYGYDENGNRTLVKKRDNNQIIFGYDALNRMTSKDLPGTTADVAYGYDLRGLQRSTIFSASGVGVTTDYDGFGRIVQTTSNVGGSTRVVSYGYDADGNRTRLTFPDGNYFGYAYDGLNRLWRICENELNCDSSASPIISLTYNAQGRRAQLTRGASVSSSGYTYDAISRLNTLSQDLDGSATGSDVSMTLSLSPVSQILSNSISNTSYTYSPAVASRGYTPNGLNQYTQISSPAVTLAYDANGNMTSDGTSTFNYDVENRLTSASGALNATLSYDPNGRLSQTSGSNTTQFLYDGDRLIGEYNASGTLLRRYVHGAMNDEPLIWYEGSAVGASNRKYFHANHQGSVIALASASGATLEKDSYDAYGLPSGSNTSRFQFTGQAYVPELGLYYYKARFYNPSLGRFMQVDPIGYKDDLNLYAYVGNDPSNMTDPTGNKGCGGIFLDTQYGGGCDHDEASWLYDPVKYGKPAGPDSYKKTRMTAPGFDLSSNKEKPATNATNNSDKKTSEGSGESNHGENGHVVKELVYEGTKLGATATIAKNAGHVAGAAAEGGAGVLQGGADYLNARISFAKMDYDHFMKTGDHEFDRFQGYDWHGSNFEEALQNRVKDLGLGENE